MLLCHITQDTVLNSISATVLFGLAVSLATIIDAHAALTYLNNYDRNDYDYDRLYPITVPAKAAAVSVIMHDCMHVYYRFC